MQTLVNRLIREQDGQTMAEYALILLTVAVVLIGAFTAVGAAIGANVETVSAQFP